MSRGSDRRSRRASRPKDAAPPARGRRRPRRGGRSALALAGVLLLVLVGGGLALWSGRPQAAGPAAPTAVPTVDARLVIRPHVVPIAAVLSRGVRLNGTLYPGYPGRNTLAIVARGDAGAPAPGARLVLVATMSGMAMTPIRTVLVGHGYRYNGALTLPMFGSYRARVSLDTPAGAAAGTLALTLPLSLTQ